MLRDGRGFKKVILICGATDLRRGWPGLSSLIQLSYGLDPYEKGTLCLFCGRRSDLIKGICFEGIGMAVYTLRLARGNQFHWPRNADEARAISPEQYKRLMEGFTIEGSIKEVYPKTEP
ncbi:MAG: IS66 family insertion sequence element accessory protein TnpB [Lachnospiraceae bacterium]|nr:IS66 family insertion sequence element accessory protein TnpB [Lachnospiraceae bacterium]